MASVMQTIFSLSSFEDRYFPTSAKHWESCQELLPADCVDCQMHKIADGLLSGRYSHPAKHEAALNPLAHESPTPIFQEGVRPVGFKALIGKGHEEFSTMRQQDSEEFFTHLLKVLRRSLKKSSTPATGSDPTTVFSFGMEQRLQCGDCKKVRYRVDGTDVVSVAVPATEKSKDAEGKIVYEDVQLTDSLDSLLGVEVLEYTCPSCAKKVIAQK